MKANEQLGRIMTTMVRSVDPRDSMEVVHVIFQKANFHHLPVVDHNGVLVGLLSKEDYHSLQDSFTMFRKAENAEAQNRRLFQSLLVEEVMTTKLAVLGPEDTVSTALGYFQESRFRAIPIVGKDRELLGIITPLDLLNFAFSEYAN